MIHFCRYRSQIIGADVALVHEFIFKDKTPPYKIDEILIYAKFDHTPIKLNQTKIDNIL